MGSLKRMKMTFTFEEKQQSKPELTMATRKYNNFHFVSPWWFSWTAKMVSASG